MYRRLYEKDFQQIWRKSGTYIYSLTRMTQQEAKEFLYGNDEALKLLSKKMREIDTVRDCANQDELYGRQKAIQIIESWITEIFGIADGDKLKNYEEESLYVRLIKGRNEPNNF